MFENIGTALVQAVGFFGVFGFFVYQLLSDGKKQIQTPLKSPIKKVNKSMDLIDKTEKKVVKSASKNKLNQILNKYPYFPYILGISLLAILVIDLVNYYK